MSARAFQRIAEWDFFHIAHSLHQLGIISQKKGDFDGANGHYRASLDMERRIHGEDADHPNIATSLDQLAMILQKKGNLMGLSRSTARV